MPTCNAMNSGLPLRSNYCVNVERDGNYEGECTWKNVPSLAGTPFRSHDRMSLFPLPPQNQSYEGEFFRDSMHGQGTYKWDDLAVFEGGFYSNHREGYATVSFRNNCYFEGLFVRNKPFGPGIFTYANGRQDAGFWMGRKLVRLSRAADYIIPRLAPTSAAKIKLLQFRRLIPLDDQKNSVHDILDGYNLLGPVSAPYSSLVYDPRSAFFDRKTFEKTYFVSISQLSRKFQGTPRATDQEGEEAASVSRESEEFNIPASPHCLCPQDVFEMQYKAPDEVDVCDMGSSADSQTGILYNLTKYGTMERPMAEEGDEEEEEERKGEEEEGEMEELKAPKIVSWNRSELCTEMLKQIFRYRAFEDKLNFNLAKLMLGVRTAFRRTGAREKECLHFLKMCSLGPPHAVKELLCNHEISEELMDARGNNSVMFAAATDQLDVIDILLDYGVDVNAFNDEGLTPLNLCLLRRLAYSNKVSSWETAFLPKEIDQTTVPEGYSQNEPWEGRQSIPSLDRVFGDGMSMSDSKTLLDSQLPIPPTSPSVIRDPSERSQDSSTVSQITVLNILRSARSLLDSSLEDLNQALLSNRSQLLTAHSKPLVTNETTPKINIKIVPKSNKRDEFERSILKTATDKYLFEFTFEKRPPPVLAVGSRKKEGSAKSVKTKPKKEESVVSEDVEEAPDFELIEKIQVIDRTIEKLLKRGADPNISEVPKPSIHLGVYTKDISVVRLLLTYGASPDSQLYPNEGLLTPLHVLVLLKSAAEFVEICQLLLSFGANPEKETRPEFFISEEEKSFLDGEQGRTPLQLLCMRPDAEYADPKDNLIKIALMLARVSNKKHFYNGHSCLTLAMYSANLKLLKALLQSKYFDPNDLLGKDLGTPLHVLVSTAFQKKTLFEMSIKICDLLLDAGADPMKELKSPQKLLGNCVDFGYREIESEKEARKPSAAGRKGSAKGEKGGKEKGGARDHLKDHVRVVEYLKEVVRRRKAGEPDRESKSKFNDSAAKKNRKKSSEDSRRIGQSKGTERGGSKDVSMSEESKRIKDGEDIPEDTKSGGKTGRQEGELEKDEGRKSKKDDKKGKKGGDKEGVRKKTKKDKNKEDKDFKEKGAKELGSIRTESNLQRSKTRASTKSQSVKAGSETFPEKVRQNLLKLFGTCVNLDVNELLLPYVVLRDGELYYRFQGTATGQKEQYSLI